MSSAFAEYEEEDADRSTLANDETIMMDDKNFN